MKAVKLIDRLNKNYVRDAIQRMQVYHWIKEVKSRRNDLSNIPRSGRALDEELDDCIGKASKRIPAFQWKRLQVPWISTPRRCETIWPSSGDEIPYKVVPPYIDVDTKGNIKRWPEACGKRYKAMQPPTPISWRLAMSCERSMNAIMKHWEQRHGRKWVNLSGRCIITRRRWSLRFLMV